MNRKIPWIYSAKRVWKTILAAGTVACGVIITVSGWQLEADLNGPFRDNLAAMEKTIQELDQTIKKAGADVAQFDAYLGEVQKQLLAIQSGMGTTNGKVSDLVMLAGQSSRKVLVDASSSLNDASHMLRVTANQAGEIPFDPLADQRSDMYSMAGTLKSTSRTLKTTAESLTKMTGEFGEAAQSLIAEAQKTVEATADQIGVLKVGSFRQIPQTLSAASDQMHAHLKMLSASSHLVVQCCRPVMALGLGVLLLGLRDLLSGRSQAAVVTQGADCQI